MADMTAEERANAILASGSRITSRPYPGDPTKRIVGWVVDADLAGISDGIFAIEVIQNRARCKGCGFVPPATSTPSP